MPFDHDEFEQVPLVVSRMASEDSDDVYLMNPRRRRRSSMFCCQFVVDLFRGCCQFIARMCRKRVEYHARTIRLGIPSSQKNLPPNAVRNQKYNLVTFVPLVLLEQFTFFLNFYFLCMALSQFFPQIRVGYLFTYWGPLLFVLTITLIREAYDDMSRFFRDKEVNSQRYEKLTFGHGLSVTTSAKIQVGDVIIVKKDQRVPADMLLLRTTEKSGACFIRTDQLDGETDWKLRIAVPSTQRLESDADMFRINATVFAEKPQKEIHSFIGTFRKEHEDGTIVEESLSVENMVWANTVIASGTAAGLVVYTGTETRSTMNASLPKSKAGLVDLELNNLTKLLFVVVVGLAFVMVFLKGFNGMWYRYLIRFVLLFSYIIPISLRVNMDMAKTWYMWVIGRDKQIPDTVVRSSTISEELGRISYLLSDKTGTLTKNVMIFKKLHLGSVGFSHDTFDDVTAHLRNAYYSGSDGIHHKAGQGTFSPSVKQPLDFKVQQAVEAIALCHNVTPSFEGTSPDDEDATLTEADQQLQQKITYQASSPDEVALVAWTESVNVTLIQRDFNTMQLRTPDGAIRRYAILQLFPFTSESKRMGIIIRDEATKKIVFYMKGADAVMQNIVQYNDWLMEECSNMAREGLRTLVVAKKELNEQQYSDFELQYHQAKVSVVDRATKAAAVLSRLEQDMSLLCLTGVEDSLQDDVKTTLELLRNAGIKIWMLTGDKQETAICIAKSTSLVARSQNIHVFKQVTSRTDAHAELNALRRKVDTALVITGDSLKVVLENYEEEFANLALDCTAVICCRCSPEQKAQIVHMLKRYQSSRRIAAIGDGGNDVSMITAAHAGIGIVGKEGRQASLAADFSITQFSHLARLLLVHGRYCYKRSCSLGQFVIHRGLLITTMQAIFSLVFYYASVSLYQGLLMVAFSTIYTSFPILSLVMDKDIKEEIAMTYPELYKDLVKGRSLTFKTFFIWFLGSIYQGAAIMFLSLLLFDQDFMRIVSITFTALIITELIMVALNIHIWHWAMIVAEAFSLAIYFISLFVLKDYFDIEFVRTGNFIWKTVVITLVSCLPLYIFKFLRKRIAPPNYIKLS